MHFVKKIVRLNFLYSLEKYSYPRDFYNRNAKFKAFVPQELQQVTLLSVMTRLMIANFL